MSTARVAFLLGHREVYDQIPTLTRRATDHGSPYVYFDIFKSSRNGRYWWVAKGENHETLCSSELMTTKQSCINGISVVKHGAQTANVYDETGERSGDVAARRIGV